MSPVAASGTGVFSSVFSAELKALQTAPTAPDAKAAADDLARAVKKAGLASLLDGGVLQTLQSFSTNKKSGYERESAAVGYDSLSSVIGVPALPVLLPILPILLELLSDKGDVVRSAATSAIRSIISLTPVLAIQSVMEVLGHELTSNGKWKAKVFCLNQMARLVDKKNESVKDEVAKLLGKLLPLVEAAMHDSKPEVASAAKKTATAFCETLPNPDLRPHIPLLVSAMAAPDTVPNTIKALSNTTFVSEVTTPSLAVLVPLLTRGLNDRSMDTQRRTVVVAENVCKLVRDPAVAAACLGSLVEGVEKIATGASFPEVRAFASSALQTLLSVGASKTVQPSPERDISAEISLAINIMKLDLPQSLFTPSPNDPQLPSMPFHPLFNQSLRFSGRLVADIVYKKHFTDATLWNQAISTYIQPWLNGEEAEADQISELIRIRFWEAEKATWPAPIDDGSGDVLCNTVFSLAYGALLLLSHTTLRLVRGGRYGICAGNGSGKTTLMRAIKDGKVENFPSQEELRAVLVEHSLQGEDASLPIIDFISADPALANVERSIISQQLEEVGFTAERQTQTVGSLSGGWKMKLELARAMLYKADLLLLDEPTNHLDVGSVKWLEDYLISHVNVTCLIVSHDSGFLDNVTTDIIHYENKKLVYYPGNLSNFVNHVPSAKSYYTLAATSVKFSFPPPGNLMGVRSNTRAIMKMSDCTFSYPGRNEPSLIDVSCALSLSSRVGIVGPNGAGKSTLIKLLTGETEPQSGTVYKHPSLRVGYVSQHATHHIEKHLDKTPVAYIQWRFQDGHDREILEKSSRVLSEEERVLLDQDVVGKNGEKRKIEMILGRQKLKKSFQYEIKWRGLDHKFNTWLPREDLIEKGFGKLITQFDDIEASREGAATKETSASAVKKTLTQVGLDENIAIYNEMGGLSGGQKVKVVIAAALWNNPQVLVLDEPTNFLDREALGGLAVAIRDWAGAVLIISHNMEFVNALCPEIWNVEAGRLTQKGKTAVVEDAFADGKSRPGSKKASAVPTPVASASATPAGSGDEKAGIGPGGLLSAIKKKKKPTRNQVKAREERRKARKLHWLSFGGPKPEDTDSD